MEEQSLSPIPNVKPTNDKLFKISLIIIGFLIVLGLFGNIYLLAKKQTSPVAQPIPTPIPTQIVTVPTINPAVIDQKFENILSEVKAEFESNYKDSEIIYPLTNLSVLWISPDGLAIASDDSTGLELKLKCDSKNEPLKEVLKVLVPKIDIIFKKNGYMLNKLNSSTSLSLPGPRFNEYIQAYERDDIKCTFIGQLSCGKYENEQTLHQSIFAVCTDKYEDNYRQQAPYLKDLEIKDSSIKISKKNGDFILYDIFDAYGIAINESGKWIKLYEGQDSPTCDVVNKYKIPKEIITTCNAPDGSNQPNLN